MHVWGPHSRLQDLSIVIATKNDYLLLIEFLKKKTMVKRLTSNNISTLRLPFDIINLSKVQTKTNI